MEDMCGEPQENRMRCDRHSTEPGRKRDYNVVGGRRYSEEAGTRRGRSLGGRQSSGREGSKDSRYTGPRGRSMQCGENLSGSPPLFKSVGFERSTGMSTAKYRRELRPCCCRFQSNEKCHRIICPLITAVIVKLYDLPRRIKRKVINHGVRTSIRILHERSLRPAGSAQRGITTLIANTRGQEIAGGAQQSRCRGANFWRAQRWEGSQQKGRIAIGITIYSNRSRIASVGGRPRKEKGGGRRARSNRALTAFAPAGVHRKQEAQPGTWIHDDVVVLTVWATIRANRHIPPFSSKNLLVVSCKGFEMSCAAAVRLTRFAGMKRMDYRKGGRGGQEPQDRVGALFALIMHLATYVVPREVEIGQAARTRLQPS